MIVEIFESNFMTRITYEAHPKPRENTTCIQEPESTSSRTRNQILFTIKKIMTDKVLGVTHHVGQMTRFAYDITVKLS